MSDRKHQVALVVLGVALAGWGAWWWHQNLELRVSATASTSEAAHKNPMLAATRLLQQHKHPVTLAESLDELALGKLADGVMIISNNEGIATPTQSAQLMAWVRRGNVLVTQPRWIGKSEYESAEPGSEGEHDDAGEAGADGEQEQGSLPATSEIVEHDPAGSLVGVRRSFGQRQPGRCGADGKFLPAPERPGPESDALTRIACLTLPATGQVLELDTGTNILVPMANASVPNWGDVDGDAVRGYRLDRGQVVIVAADFFDNRELRKRDHGDLLMHVVALRGPAARVLMVKRLDVTPWIVALWEKFSLAIVSSAIGLALWLWAALFRFGPALPAPPAERRSLMEHVAASGAWLWKVPGGRDTLLDAVRTATLATVQRRLPALKAMSAPDQASHLNQLGAMGEADLEAALVRPAHHHPHEFARQIRTLQELRNHHER